MNSEANNIFLSPQTIISYQPTSIIFLLQQISTGHS